GVFSNFEGQLGTIARRPLPCALSGTPLRQRRAACSVNLAVCQSAPSCVFMPAVSSPKLTPAERRASTALAGLFACRMLGLFLLLPVFAVAARGLPGGDDPARVGLALGMYGLTQAFMQIPFGLA